MSNSISYIVDATLPNNSAYSIHIMKMCEAFAVHGLKIKLYINSDSYSKDKLFKSYGIKNKFEIESIGKTKLLGVFNRVAFSTKSIIKSRKSLIYTRDPIILTIALLLNKKAIYEAHGFIEFFSRRLEKVFSKFQILHKKKILKVVCISEALKQAYVSRYAINQKKIIVLHDGVNLENFTSKSELFKTTQLKIAFFGSLYEGKGLEIIVEIAINMEEVLFHIYGGENWQIDQIKDKLLGLNIKNIIFHGHVQNSEIPSIQSTYDILLMPYKNKVIGRGVEDISQWMSPMKMFEYMASGSVIISSNLPVIQEVLNTNNAYLVDPDNIDQWIDTIKHIEKNKLEAKNKALKALRDVEKYSWKSRAEFLLGVMNE